MIKSTELECKKFKDGRDDLDLIIQKLFDDDNLIEFQVTRRDIKPIETRGESALTELIENKIQTKALPLALRKRLMYERALSA